MISQDKTNPSLERLEKAARLGPASLFRGEMTSKEGLLVQGQFQGKIDLPENDLLVAESGKLEAEINVRNVIVRGEVSGNIHASGRITIEKTGRMKGDLSALLISIEDGAQFKGSVRILARK